MVVLCALWAGAGCGDQMSNDPAALQRAADRGNAEAQFKLGILYYQGKDVPENTHKGLALLQKAADQGYTPALYNLGLRYDHGGMGVEQDEAKAAALYQKAADQGHASAQINLGRMYAGGRGVPQDDAKAVKLFQKAADQGDVIGKAGLGEAYATGFGVPKDVDKGCALLREAAAKRPDAAQDTFDRYCSKGIPNANRDPTVLQQAADKGDAKARHTLGTMYLWGDGVPKDVKKGCGLLREALAKGANDAQMQETLELYCPK